MSGKLISLPAGELLAKFGAGNHKPGSGSAAALQGMLSAQLIQTVIELTSDKKRRRHYKDQLPKLQRIADEVRDRVYPALCELFQQDSEVFDQVIQLRDARDKEQDGVRKKQLQQQALEMLKKATEIPITIANLGIELGGFSIEIFDHGFRSARGDSGVAINNAVSCVAGCLAIINLNLLSFGNDQWTERVGNAANTIRTRYEELSAQAKGRLAVLENEVQDNKSFHKELQELSSGQWVGIRLSDNTIEDIARQLQLTLWNHRAKFWKHDTPTAPVDVIRPDIALYNILGYQFHRPETLGLQEFEGQLVEVAGLIDKSEKLVAVSRQLPETIQRFTAAHELGHALMHEQTVLHRDRPLDGSDSPTRRDFREIQADKFAAYFLMPKKQLMDIFQELFGTNKFILNEDSVFALNGGSLSAFRRRCKNQRALSRIIAEAEFYRDKPFRSLAQVFGVSTETMAIRLEELGLVEY